MILFFIQVITSILGVIGFFTYNDTFMKIGIVSLLICSLIGLIYGALRTIRNEVWCLIIGCALSLFIDRSMLACIAISYCTITLFLSFLGTIIMLVPKKRKVK